MVQIRRFASMGASVMNNVSSLIMSGGFCFDHTSFAAEIQPNLQVAETIRI
jgi:hypothetical protein